MSVESRAQHDLEAQFRTLTEAVGETDQSVTTATMAKKTPLNPEDTAFGGRPASW